VKIVVVVFFYHELAACSQLAPSEDNVSNGSRILQDVVVVIVVTMFGELNAT
jgi:hypothetical protein